MSHHFALRATNLKGFGDDPEGFDEIKIVNLIIGRNNSGKSSMIDMINQACLKSVEIPSAMWHGNKPAAIFSETVLTADDLKRVFPENTSGGEIRGSHHLYGTQFVGAKITARLTKQNANQFHSVQLDETQQRISPGLSSLADYCTRLANLPTRNPFHGREFRRLSAERDISPEIDSPTLDIRSNGVGATNMIQHFINKSHLPSDLVEKDILESLNTIFGPDATFEDIVCQQHADNTWEIFLEEADKGRIPLSQSGSGLKTVMLVLCFVHLLPTVAKRPLKEFVFGFEELENNLHPALQRRLLAYLAERARIESFTIFLTTHSSVAIDMFSRQEDAQVVHVTHDGKRSHAKTVRTYIENRGVLDDLDVRASDLLQANGVIWVEGPSDRIYLNRWIELWSDGKFREGTHYQCIFYGGRLLAHLSAAAPDDEASGVSMLSVNKNAAVVIDSDKRSRQTPVNATKKRILSEIQAIDGVAWISSGREIENYVPAEAVAVWLGGSIKVAPQTDCYESFFDYLDRLRSGLGVEFSQRKPLLAEHLIQGMTKENLRSVPGLPEKLDEMCSAIENWNSG